MNSFFTLDEVRLIGFCAIGVFGFAVPFTIFYGIKYWRESRDIALDKKWAEYTKRTGKPEPASNRARQTPYVPKRPQGAAVPRSAPVKRSPAPVAPKPAQRPAVTPKPAQRPASAPARKAWDSWSPDL